MAVQKFTFVIVILFTIATSLSWATEIEDEISGFTQDSTITRAGHEFARYVSDYRNANFSTDNNYNLVIFERPSARWGSLIWVTTENQEVYRRFLPPGRIDLQLEANRAAQQIHAAAQQRKMQLLFMDTFDLDQDEY